MYGLKKNIQNPIVRFVLFLFFLPVQQVLAQDIECISTNCNTIQANWELTAGKQAIICEGEDFQLRSAESTPLDNISEFRWYFVESATGDILFDTVLTDTSWVTYNYKVSDSLACIGNSVIPLKVTLAVYSPECANGQSCNYKTSSLIVKLLPRARFNMPFRVCENEEVSFENISCHGDSVIWNFGDGTTSTEESPVKIYDKPGFYNVRLTVFNDCGTDTELKQIEVAGEPKADFSWVADPDDRCTPVRIDFKNESNAFSQTRWQIFPTDTALWEFSDTNMHVFSKDISVLIKQAGNYSFKLTGENGCAITSEKEETITIYNKPVINLVRPAEFCDQAVVSSKDLAFNIEGDYDQVFWEFENAENIDTLSGTSFSNVTFLQTGSITLTVTGPCDRIERTIPIVISKTPAINFDPSNPREVCQTASIVELKATPAGGFWVGKGEAAGAINREGQLTPGSLPPGIYSFAYTSGSALCQTDNSISVEVKAAVEVNLTQPGPACERIDFTPKVSYEGDIDSYFWVFSGSSISNSTDSFPSDIPYDGPGVYQITAKAEGSCGVDEDTIILDVQRNVPLSIQQPNNVLCSSSSPDTLRVNSPGGRWTGPGIIDQDFGVFDPGSVNPNGSYQVVYSLDNGACKASDTITLEVLQSESVSVPDVFVCVDSEPQRLIANPNGGSWEGIAGLNTQTGILDPSQLTPNVYTATYVYTDASGCVIRTNGKVTVEAVPGLSMDKSINLCFSDIDVDLPSVLNFGVSPPGGTVSWSGPGVINSTSGAFNSGVAGVGPGSLVVNVQYVRNDCVVRDSVAISLEQAPVLQTTADTSVCILDSLIQLKANLEGGSWNGGPGIVDPVTGLIDLEAAGGGIQSYTYTFGKGTSCEQQARTELEIVDLRSVVNAGPAVVICEGEPTFSFTDASPAFGTWSGPGIIDPLNGTVDLSALQRDTAYIYQYCLESAQVQGGCQACSQKSFTVYSKPQADFELDGTACIDEQITYRVEAPRTDLTFDWDLGDSTSSSLREPSHRYTGKGTYSVRMAATSTEGCTTERIKNYYITTRPTVEFALDETNGCAPFEVLVQNTSMGDSISQQWIIGTDTVFGGALRNYVIDSLTRTTTFGVRLEVTNLCGTVSQQDSITVSPYPFAEFGIDQDEGCSPLEVNFANTTVGEPDLFFWDLGNGTTFSQEKPAAQSYFTQDTAVSEYTLSLVASNQCGVDTFQKKITVFPPDVDAFIELDTLAGCDPLLIKLESFSTPGAKVSWRFISPTGELSGSEAEDPLIELQTPGEHMLILYAASCGIDTDTNFIEVLPAPDVQFIHRPFICEGEPLKFVNQTENISGSFWDFGDGETSTEFSPTHSFDSAGTYTVTLTVYSLLNNCPNTITSTVEVRGNPIAQCTPSTTQGCSPLIVDFTNQSRGASDLRYIWDFGDGSSQEFTESPRHIFERPGNYQVKMTAFDVDSCFSDTTILNIFVFDDPVSSFIIEDTKEYCLGYDSIYLRNQSVDAVSFEWRFQGNTYNTESPVLLPFEHGNFDLELIVRNGFECADTSSLPVTVLPSPLADFVPDLERGCEDLAVQFTNNSQNSDLFVWDFVDGNSSTDQSPRHIFKTEGSYQVRLIADNNNRCPTDTAYQLITVLDKPLADFTFAKEMDCGTPVRVNFTNSSSGNIDNAWSFGDGSSSDLAQPDHTYLNNSDNTVRLIVTNQEGCKDTIDQKVGIFGNPMADFELSAGKGCERDTITLVNRSLEALEYEWNIESIGRLTEAAPELVFPVAGDYEVELIAIYNGNCRDTLSQPITVYQRPVAQFDVQPDGDPDRIGDVQFLNRTQQADRYQWDLGDGTITVEESPYHEYSINRSIPVELLAYNDNNGAFVCVDTAKALVDPEWITTFFAPNAMAPDFENDGVRYFRPVGVGLDSYQIRVYSPWGTLVWMSEELENGRPSAQWDGTYDGSPLPQGAYTWVAQLNFVSGNKRTQTGTVTILR